MGDVVAAAVLRLCGSDLRGKPSAAEAMPLARTSRACRRGMRVCWSRPFPMRVRITSPKDPTHDMAAVDRARRDGALHRLDLHAVGADRGAVPVTIALIGLVLAEGKRARALQES